MSPSKGDGDYHDGTHAGAFGDALSGPVGEDDSDDFQLTRVASPVRPESSGIDFSARPTTGGFGEILDVDAPKPDVTPPGVPTQPIPPAPPLGILPRQRSRAGLRSMKRPALKMPRFTGNGGLRPSRPSSGSTGVIIAVLMMIVFAFVAIEFLSSLISSISGLFN
ncbi:hypothetical protein [Amycolatopsis sp.]|uniref:hypothetical protein n=1 Tax=Amycolatopsis sp. TaxID=37632 RepID=UPI002BCEA7DD|nr:hypothetical protein [Amycolatopsis sp.]HVV12315.1 hypothetical protein [Amycolatopsis sp.]